MRFALTTAIIAILCGIASYVAATHGDGLTFTVGWFQAFALLSGIGCALSAGASGIRFIVFAGDADADATLENKQLAAIRARMEAQALEAQALEAPKG